MGVENTESNRRDWRQLLYTAPGLGQYISGCIMFEETLYQNTREGKPFVEVLSEEGITPGIKVCPITPSWAHDDRPYTLPDSISQGPWLMYSRPGH